MMVLPAELGQLERDFFSGRNPLAYIPLCQGLRRQREFVRALEICQRGLAGDPDSLAGRRLHARLLIDLGHYEEALREVGRAEGVAPDAAGLRIEKAHCLIRLGRFDEAKGILEGLNARYFMSPDVQMLNTLLREKVRGSQEVARPAPPSVEAPLRVIRKSNREILDAIREELQPLVVPQCLAVIPVGAGEPALEGNPLHAEAGYEFFRSTSMACRDLETGKMRTGLIETDSVQLIVLVRRNTIVAVSFGPTQNFGKVFHRLVTIAGQLLPEAHHP